MFKKLLDLVVFVAGLAVVCWIGLGYVHSNPLGAVVAAVIGVAYLTGSLELFRYSAANSTLQQAVADVPAEGSPLGEWLSRLHPSLRNAVRLRIEGERVGLPAPALTSYLVGLLVLLGMLGTLLGMMATLRGTGSALQSATDLAAIRGSIAAPVNGLAFAFGTSIAGVASSAMLGLLAALCRRERQQVVQQLDVQIGSTLRIHSQAHQREESFKLLQQQSELMPALIDRLHGMMTAIEQQSAALNERQLASQTSFHSATEATYARLASSVEQSLKNTLDASARATAEVLQPIVTTIMTGIASETSALHDNVTQAMQQQLAGLSSGFETTSKTVTAIWNDALAQQRQTNAQHADDLRGSLEQFAATFKLRSTDLLAGVSTRLDATADHATQALQQALSQQQAVNQTLADHNQQALNTATATFETRATSLVQIVQQSHTELQSTLESRDQQRLTNWSEKLDAITTGLHQQWQQTSELATDQQQAICDTLARTASDMSVQAQTHASATIAEISRLMDATAEAPRIAAEVVAEMRQKLADSMARDTATMESLVQVVQQSHEQLQTTLESRDQQRLASWSEKLDAITSGLHQQWQQTSELATEQQQAICDTLARTASDMSAQTQTHASATIAEISRLIETASEAPRIAAEVVTELRQKLSDSMARDSAMVESLVQTVQQSHESLQSTLESRDQQRLASWSEKLDAITGGLHQQWQQTSALATDQQQAICDTLARTASDMSAQSQAHGNATIAEISRLMDAASEAPRIAAEVVAELRQKLSDSMVRDTDMLEERGRLLATLESLLGAVNHASTEQREAIDALVTTSADLLERVGNRFSEQIADETGKLDGVAAQLTGSAVEVASLGEAFGAGVALFSSSNEALMERLQQIAGALDSSLTRSDEQLAYYVAQAREVVDLSVLSQKQIIEDMQRLASQQGAAADASA